MDLLPDMCRVLNCTCSGRQRHTFISQSLFRNAAALPYKATEWHVIMTYNEIKSPSPPSLGRLRWEDGWKRRKGDISCYSYYLLAGLWHWRCSTFHSDLAEKWKVVFVQLWFLLHLYQILQGFDFLLSCLTDWVFCFNDAFGRILIAQRNVQFQEFLKKGTVWTGIKRASLDLSWIFSNIHKNVTTEL